MKLGFIVNPIAGMGGKVGLKGTDNVLKEAIAKGAEPVAPRRATEFLKELKGIKTNAKIELVTCPKKMGEEEARGAEFKCEVLPMNIGRDTSAEDTKTAAKLMATEKVDLIVFVGGDGTARDVFDALQNTEELPVLGVPSGVKMYSGVFAVNLLDAAEVVVAFAEKTAETTEFEIMDADEEAIRNDAFNVKLYGFLKGPFLPAHIQGSKQVSPENIDEADNQKAIARFILEEIPSDATLILGPGTTVKRLAELLGVKKTILGVDICSGGKVIPDVDEKKILDVIEDWCNVWIILSPIGHQGIILGRGNQQISPKIVKRIGKERLVIAATKSKLQSIEGNVLRVDTEDAELNNMLRGYMRVVTDYREWRLVQVR